MTNLPEKKTVRYRGEAMVLSGGAFLQPVDHPDSANVSNKEAVRTSRVLAHCKSTGRIETANTIYIPVKPCES
jgi:hypothetical protein